MLLYLLGGEGGCRDLPDVDSSPEAAGEVAEGAGEEAAEDGEIQESAEERAEEGLFSPGVEREKRGGAGESLAIEEIGFGSCTGPGEEEGDFSGDDVVTEQKKKRRRKGKRKRTFRSWSKKERTAHNRLKAAKEAEAKRGEPGVEAEHAAPKVEQAAQEAEQAPTKAAPKVAKQPSDPPSTAGLAIEGPVVEGPVRKKARKPAWRRRVAKARALGLTAAAKTDEEVMEKWEAIVTAAADAHREREARLQKVQEGARRLAAAVSVVMAQRVGPREGAGSMGEEVIPRGPAVNGNKGKGRATRAAARGLRSSITGREDVDAVGESGSKGPLTGDGIDGLISQPSLELSGSNGAAEASGRLFGEENRKRSASAAVSTAKDQAAGTTAKKHKGNCQRLLKLIRIDGGRLFANTEGCRVRKFLQENVEKWWLTDEERPARLLALAAERKVRLAVKRETAERCKVAWEQMEDERIREGAYTGVPAGAGPGEGVVGKNVEKKFGGRFYKGVVKEYVPEEHWYLVGTWYLVGRIALQFQNVSRECGSSIYGSNSMLGSCVVDVFGLQWLQDLLFALSCL